MSHINAVIRIHHQADEIIHLGLVCIVKLIEACHLFHRHGLRSYLLSKVLTAGKYQFQRTKHIKEGGVMPAVGLAGSLGFHAADDVVASGLSFKETPRFMMAGMMTSSL